MTHYIKTLSLLFLVTLLFSCKNTKRDIMKQSDVVTDSINETDKKTIRAIGETLTPNAKKKVENWVAYKQLDNLLDNFYSSSPNEVLNLSKELSTTTKQLKDSIKIERFKQPDVLIRINVIHNYALRLADMSTIPSITADEVKEETQNILDAFSALNSKINNLTKTEELEEELKEYDAPILLEREDSLLTKDLK
ncbi:hypothetical protein EGM88_08245 [Aureibaculum marinum]|uniref:Lipoprotein n=2 Tax=Aureibaculum marinum TaxID=2487930 RepID=A0A3N4NTV2_9FLAO|nr:hypothetical protein EGM88_08245 [Aureibaculum marinum]